MRILILGAPGAGKGTQANLLANRLQIEHISTGEILRDSIQKNTAIGQQAKQYVTAGDLVPDETMVSMIDERLQQEDVRAGFILDGFPRNLAQLEKLREKMASRREQIDLIIHIDLAEKILYERLLLRAKKEGRTDDSPLIIKKRMKTHQKYTIPVIDFYRANTDQFVISVDGQFSPNKVNDTIMEKIKEASVDSTGQKRMDLDNRRQ